MTEDRFSPGAVGILYRDKEGLKLYRARRPTSPSELIAEFERARTEQNDSKKGGAKNNDRSSDRNS